jgi:membrane complex biogenesis BtpA family protein
MVSSRWEIPHLIGVIHLLPLPGSPRYGGSVPQVLDAATRDAAALSQAGFDGIIIENYGDAPFAKGPVGPETVAAMTAAGRRVRGIAPQVPIGINVLRNDARAALAVAVASEATMVRINVHMGARVTDQGIVEGAAYETLRYRRELGAEGVRLLCDVAVKHSAALSERRLREEACELVERGMADAVLVTGSGTGEAVDEGELREICRALGSPPAGASRPPEVVVPDRTPVFVASGATRKNLDRYRDAYGIIVGSALRASGRAGDPIEPELAADFARHWNKIRRAR